MPFWWGRKSAKTKEQHFPEGDYLDLSSKPSINNESKKRAEDKLKTTSDDVVFASTNSPRKSSDSTGSSSRTGSSSAHSNSTSLEAVLDSGSGRTRPIPLSRPSGMYHRDGLGSGSGSLSNLSSSGSSNDHNILDHGPFHISRLVALPPLGFDSFLSGGGRGIWWRGEKRGFR